MERWQTALAVIAVIVIVGLLFASVTSRGPVLPPDGVSPTPTPTVASPTPTATPIASPTPGNGNRIIILYGALQPAYLQIAVNSVVTWVNQDGVAYEFNVVGPQNFSTGLIGGGQTYQRQFNQSGTYTFKESRYGTNGTILVT